MSMRIKKIYKIQKVFFFKNKTASYFEDNLCMYKVVSKF